MQLFGEMVGRAFGPKRHHLNRAPGRRTQLDLVVATGARRPHTPLRSTLPWQSPAKKKKTINLKHGLSWREYDEGVSVGARPTEAD